MLASAVAVVALGSGVPAHAQAAPVVPAPAGALGASAVLSPGMVEAMQRDLGLTEERTRRTLQEQWQAAAMTEPRLRAVLGDRFAGAWWDSAGADGAGDLVIGVTGAGLSDTVRAGGARPVVVARTERELDGVKAALDAVAVPKSVTSWYVDLPGNTVVVEAQPEALAAARAFVAAAGVDRSAVRVVASNSRPRPLYDIRGGDRFNISGSYCSIGFAVDRGFVTAGHCVSPGAPTTGVNGAPQGVAQAGVYPGADYGWVQTNADWVPRPVVNGSVSGTHFVGGMTEALVGASVCRAGVTSGWDCGRVEAKNVTVNYSDGNVYGLTRTSACSLPGDSGGPFLAGTQAQGVLSGGDTNDSCPGGRSYFQPLRPILNAYGLTLTTANVLPVDLACETYHSRYSCEVLTGGATAPVTIRWYLNNRYNHFLDDRWLMSNGCIAGTQVNVRVEVSGSNGVGRAARGFTCSSGPRN